ncbi:MAG: esterase family protein [Chitinophagaceae bacterium]|nr:esterase family protein [Chitinophagaceae bacterium]
MQIKLRMYRLFTFLLTIVISISTKAAIIDTVSIYSAAMRKSAKCVVIIPEADRPEEGWPVVYLLHGYSGDATNWITKVPVIAQYADDFKVMIVCPDGDYSSWYIDSPVDSTMRYATYIGREVPHYIDGTYPTLAQKEGRAITGLSMGGHGGLYLGLKYSDMFSACGSMSGGVDLFCCTNRFDVDKRIGDTTVASFQKYSVASIVEKLDPANAPRIIFDCGTEDFFYDINAKLHQKMVSLKIPHEYIERPGKHDWEYWGNALQYQLLFFTNHFKQQLASIN